MLTIEPGKVYWIELDTIRLRVRVIRASLLVPGWWRCQSILTGDELKVPASVFREEAKDDGLTAKLSTASQGENSPPPATPAAPSP